MGHETWYAAVALEYVFATLALQLAVVFALSWFVRREDRYLLWFATWCGAAVFTLVVNAVLFSVPPESWDGGLLLLRNLGLGAVAVLVIPPLCLLAGRRIPWLLLAAVAAVYIARIIVWETTDLLYRHASDEDGYPIYGPLETVFALVPLVLILSAALYYLRAIPSRVQRRTIYAAMAVILVIIPLGGAVPSARLHELVNPSWPIPGIIALAVIGLQRLVAAELSRGRLQSRQAALAVIGSSALRHRGPGAGGVVAEEARRLLERELRCSVRLEPGSPSETSVEGSVEDAAEVTAEVTVEDAVEVTVEGAADREPVLTVPGARGSWTARFSGSRRPFTEADRHFAATVLQVVSWAADRAAAEADLRRSALHDPLTGLPNRMLFADRLHKALERARRGGGTLAVLFCDLDGFKAVNDTQGHAAGDEVLREVAAALAGAVREADTVARFGGDEFVVVTEALADTAAVEQLADRLAAAVSEVREPGTGQPVRMSVGIAVGTGEVDADTLLRDADAAMYQAKERGAGTEVVRSHQNVG